MLLAIGAMAGARGETIVVEGPNGTQTVEVLSGPAASPMPLQPGAMPPGASPYAQPQPQPGGPPQPEGEPQPEAKPAEEGEKKEEPKTETPTGPVTRPDKPPKIADPRELQAKPDSKGKVTFSFNGQTWPDVLQWLANVSGYSLDWTELPGGYLNLTTQHPYTLAEARDLVNRQLHARGYTLILTGEVLSVFKIDKLDPALIPRVEEEQLYDMQPHDFVKITFQLPREMEVAAAAEDMKKTASEHAKIIPLPATRRILMISTVANARLVSTILNEERMASDSQVVPVEIVLKHRRAEKIIDILYVILGLDPASRPSQEELAMQQQKMQLLMQMQGAGKDVSAMLQKDGPQVYLAYNSHRNSVLINAPPDSLRKILRTVELLDVPAGGEMADLVELAGDAGRRVPKSYKLETIDPQKLQSTLEEIGDLSPLTELRADNSADILFARASAADHEKIAQMIEQLDEAGMETMVFRLRRHPADAVAGTLRTMFAPAKKEESQEDRYRSYGYWGGGYPMEEEKDTPPADVRIDADIENNRLIVRGTAEQLKQVRDFLIKLGEPLDTPDQSDRVRVVEGMTPESTAQLLEQLRRVWPQIGENELIIEGPKGAIEPATRPETETPIEVPTDREANAAPAEAAVFRFAAEASAPKPTGDTPSIAAPRATPVSGKPPVKIRVTPDGKLQLSSDDPEALDQLEQLVESAAPQEERFRIFPVKYVTAYSIYLTLKNLYKDEMTGEKSEPRYDPYWGEFMPGESKPTAAQMSKRRKLQLDWDTSSNTLLVANASADQLREIAMLIESYDQPSSKDEATARRTAAIKLRYSRAKVVAAALKEVYRDLLSTRDKEFETEDKKGATSSRETTTVIRYGQGGGDSSEDAKKPKPVKVGFQGALSVGVDEISNTIVISVQEELFDSVMQIVKSLDDAAAPQTSVAVHTVRSGVSAQALQRALSEALGTPWVGDRPEQQGKPGEQGEGENNGQGKPGQGGPQPGQPAQAAPVASE
ncbi:secretin N-terminal domain-containing protein [Aeoliella sp. SH292]|uniref:secretin N-terminal domain-containing protein n=1 Tax=Aeoliella sp. SH292 TaxID=3454464 RepID=UPI003F98D3BA